MSWTREYEICIILFVMETTTRNRHWEDPGALRNVIRKRLLKERVGSEGAK
jgi:hypothetical protein